MNPEASVSWSEVVLQKLKVASRQYLSPQLAHDARARAELDYVTNSMVVELSTHVLAEKLLKDDQSASFSETVVVEQDAARHLVIPQAALVLLTTALGFALGSVAVFLLAGLIALVSVAAFAANPPVTHERTVSGTATIPISYYASFPESTITYPRDLGPVVRLMEPGQPYVRYDQ